MTRVSRRHMLGVLGAAPVAAGMTWTQAEAAQARQQAQQARQEAARTGQAYEPKFFTAHEYDTVTALVDMILPADERSGSASDAGTPEFIDFMMVDQPGRQIAIRGGLAWLDRECLKRFDRTFLDAGDEERRQVLDDIAWPVKARPEMSHGVRFFSSLRDLTATGFFSSRIGVEDLQYMGNTFVAEWKGCPDEALRKLGVSYDIYDPATRSEEQG
jgi:gluconate 2-dehydrogenase gamma chain